MIGNGNGGATEGAARFLAVAATSPPEKVEKTDRWQKEETANAKAEQRKAETARVVEAATAPLKEKLAEKEGELVRKNAAVSILVQCKDELIVEKKALEAELASTTARSNSMFRNIVIAALVVAVGYLGYDKYQMDQANQEVQKRLEGLTTWYVDSQFGSPAALEGKTCLEITPQMQELGIARFVSIAERLPYADAETMSGLIKHNIQKISGILRPSNSDTRVVVRLESPDGTRSVLAHVNPASVSVYTYEFAQRSRYYEPRVEDYSFRWRNRYSIDDYIFRRIATYAASMPATTRAELKKLKDMFVIEAYDNERILFLIAPYGTGEWFVRLEDADYHALSSGVDRSNDCSSTLEYTNYSWWCDNVKNVATKEEQTAVK